MFTWTVFVGAACIVCGTLFCMLYMWLVARTELKRFRRSYDKPNAIVIHTYYCAGGQIPERGWEVLDRGLTFARRTASPIILTIGNTIPGFPKTEAEIYRDGARAELSADSTVQFLLGNDHSIRETYGEAREALWIATNIEARTILVVGSWPHLARIRIIWQSLIWQDIQDRIYFLPVRVPARYWFWEVLMFAFHFIAPPRSRRQKWLLDILGRKQ